MAKERLAMGCWNDALDMTGLDIGKERYANGHETRRERSDE